MLKKLKIGVLMGGPSAEHEVSLATGANVVANLDKTKYKPVVIKILAPSLNKRFLSPKASACCSAGSKTQKMHWLLNGKRTTPDKALKSCDLIFNALHGTFGEDGRVQALMEYYGARYTGSGITASALAMDKLRSREMFKLAGFCVPKTLKIKKGENYQARLGIFITKITKLPVVVKPCSNGSSVGVQIISATQRAPLQRCPLKLIKAIDETFKLDKKVLVEEFIKGREVTCGVLDGVEVKPQYVERFKLNPDGALPVTEIVPVKGHKFFNYDAKYKTGHCQEITPAQIDEMTREEVQNIAVRAHQLLGCRGYSRTDMILKNDSVYVLEVNTLPGLTSNSLFPKAAQVAGLTFSQLLDNIINSSLS